MALANRSLLVMMDTRPAITRAQQAVPQYPQLAFELNRQYACQHGYDLLFLRMRSKVCHHPSLGERHPSYCKMVAVEVA